MRWALLSLSFIGPMNPHYLRGYFYLFAKMLILIIQIEPREKFEKNNNNKSKSKKEISGFTSNLACV